MRWIASIGVLLGVLLSPATGHAQPMELLLAGEVETITETLDVPFENAAIGDPFNLRLVFDSDAPEFCVLSPQYCDPKDTLPGSSYRADSMVVTVGDAEYTWESYVGIEVYGAWGSGWDALRVGGQDQPSYLEGRYISAGFDLYDFDGSTFASEDLPETLDLVDFARLRLFAVNTGHYEEKRLLGTITSLVLRPVPEPNLAGALVIALVGLAALRAAR